MGQRIVQVDAFTDRPFGGNPAAVCVMPGPRDERWMQDVAREMNLSETAFLHREGGGFRLRWFTPAAEVDLCGHATLAGAHVLWEEGHLPARTPARFETRSGTLSASRDGDWIELDFPSKPVGTAPGPLDDLARALGTPVRFSARNEFDLLAEVETEEALRALRPDIARLAAFPVRGVIVTSLASTAGFDFVSRFFAPRLGVDEDPVCGSAHCCLGPYWGDRLGKADLVAYQASARGGILRVRVRGPRVHLGGQAVTVLRESSWTRGRGPIRRADAVHSRIRAVEPEGMRIAVTDEDEDASDSPSEGPRDRGRVVVAAVLFEAGLAPLALALGWLLGRDPLEGFAWRARDAAWGVLAALPMFALFALGMRWPAGPLARIRRFFDEEMMPLLGGRPASDWALIALAAGVGEEMLFRGALQGALGRWLGTWAGWAAASLLFGLLHPITPAYIAIAGLLGAYLGAVWVASGNLLVVIVAHALYDFLALATLLRPPRARG